MNVKAQAVMAANHGLITRAQALDCGLSSLEIRHLLRSDGLVLVRRGVYADAKVWDDLDEYVGRPRLQTRAALATMRRGWVASHDSAAHEHGMEILNPPTPHVHITRPGTTGAWTKFGVKHHLASFGDEQVQELNGLRCSTWQGRRSTSRASTARRTARSPATPPCDWA